MEKWPNIEVNEACCHAHMGMSLTASLYAHHRESTPWVLLRETCWRFDTFQGKLMSDAPVEGEEGVNVTLVAPEVGTNTTPADAIDGDKMVSATPSLPPSPPSSCSLSQSPNLSPHSLHSSLRLFPYHILYALHDCSHLYPSLSSSYSFSADFTFVTLNDLCPILHDTMLFAILLHWPYMLCPSIPIFIMPLTLPCPIPSLSCPALLHFLTIYSSLWPSVTL